MRSITLEELLEAGCHFGHQVTRQNPKARDFVFEARDGIHIIDLAKTKRGLEEAATYLRNLAKNGGTLIIVGTKRQARALVEEEVQRIKGELGEVANIFLVTERWIGGTLTNFSEVSRNYKRMKDLSELLSGGAEKEKYTKKELGLLEKELSKLKSLYQGIYEMKEIPKALLVVDSHLENLAVSEARATGVTTVGIVDTNADPLLVDYPIPANDDAVGSIKVILNFLADAWIEGAREGVRARAEAEKKASEQSEKPATPKPEIKAQAESSAEKEKETNTKKTKKTTAKKPASKKTSKNAKS